MLFVLQAAQRRPHNSIATTLALQVDPETADLILSLLHPAAARRPSAAAALQLPCLQLSTCRKTDSSSVLDPDARSALQAAMAATALQQPDPQPDVVTGCNPVTDAAPTEAAEPVSTILQSGAREQPHWAATAVEAELKEKASDVDAQQIAAADLELPGTKAAASSMMEELPLFARAVGRSAKPPLTVKCCKGAVGGISAL